MNEKMTSGEREAGTTDGAYVPEMDAVQQHRHVTLLARLHVLKCSYCGAPKSAMFLVPPWSRHPMKYCGVRYACAGCRGAGRYATVRYRKATDADRARHARSIGAKP